MTAPWTSHPMLERSMHPAASGRDEQRRPEMKALAITLVLCAATAGMAAPTASARDGTDAMERLIRQEDARRNDPRLGLVQERAAAMAARLERHADGRAGDPTPGFARAESPTSVGRRFDWPSAAVGIAATTAAFLLAFGLAIVARTQRAMRA